jgi:beta-galactosidase/beta-glucuronidase
MSEPVTNQTPHQGASNQVAVNQFEYPRPQLVRDGWMNLNGKWRFRYDDDMCGSLPTGTVDWTHEINVPFAPETELSGIADTGFHKAVWYEREFTLLPNDGRTILHFGAIDYAARIWVNGQLVAEHEGGHTPIKADITAVMNADGNQTVTVI